MIRIELLSETDFRMDSLDLYDRKQDVRKVYRWIGGDLALVECSYTEDWDLNRKRSVAELLCSDRYITYLALDDERVVGFIGLLKQLHGPYMILDMMQVSAEYRGRGIGRRLFEAGKDEARKNGAAALYISACSSEETVAFYRAMGSELARDPIREIAEKEPFDLQMVCPVEDCCQQDRTLKDGPGSMEEEEMRFEMLPGDEDDAEFIEEQAEKPFNAAAPGSGAEEEEIHYKMTDDEGNVIAGCTLAIDGQKTASIYRLWVDEAYRGQGRATALIREAEREARGSGCYLVMVGTFDWQAKPLYLKLGYVISDTMSGAPRGHEHYFLTKRLDGPSADHVPSDHKRFEIVRGDERDAEILSGRLREFDSAAAPREHDYIPLCRKITDEDGRIIAGFSGGVGGWNDTDISVWVEEKYRNRGIGSRLLREFGREAKENGAGSVFLEAYDWNVVFFKKNGYEKVTGVLEDYPKGHTMYCMEKPLE